MTIFIVMQTDACIKMYCDGSIKKTLLWNGTLAVLKTEN